MSGKASRNSTVAASASWVGMSPAEAITRSGSPPSSLLAQSQMPMPLVQWLIAACMSMILQVQLLVADDHVHVVHAAQAMVGDREQGIHVGRKINARDRRALVEHHVEETGILVGEAVVILPPDGGSDQQIQGSDIGAPRQVAARSPAISRAG